MGLNVPKLQTAADALLASATSTGDHSTLVPGIVAIVTDASGDVYTGAAGVRTLGEAEPMTLDSTFCLFSTTKAIAAVCAMQLVEEGLLDLDKPAADYVPAIGDVKLFTGWTDDGQPILVKPKNTITPRMLLTHTAGFSYEFSEPDVYGRLCRDHGYPTIASGKLEYIQRFPILFEPGTRWQYGINMDWMGLVIEAIRGMRLDDVMKKYVFEPLDMRSITFEMTPAMAAKRVSIHWRDPETSALAADPAFQLKQGAELETHNGGHGLYGTVADYTKFIRMFLNDGVSDTGKRVLKKETIDWAWEDQIPTTPINGLVSYDPTLVQKFDTPTEPAPRFGWACSFMKLLEDAPSGRPAGSVNWAGLANLFYFIDRKNKVGAYWATQMFPFWDPYAYGGYDKLENIIYDALETEVAA
ncbi:beta-lactamase/transpeptidase-like protein [Dipodascopsis tothii]|uniref:beta-lactamase/transpeptidase-like protein n=1 Tax=Dipodascopsis tothii TaxID=44089 RepID=UPI0034CFFC7E